MCQVWGFEQVNGEKRYTRHVHFVGPGGEIIDIRLVYAYSTSCYGLLPSC